MGRYLPLLHSGASSGHAIDPCFCALPFSAHIPFWSRADTAAMMRGLWAMSYPCLRHWTGNEERDTKQSDTKRELNRGQINSYCPFLSVISSAKLWTWAVRFSALLSVWCPVPCTVFACLFALNRSCYKKLPMANSPLLTSWQIGSDTLPWKHLRTSCGYPSRPLEGLHPWWGENERHLRDCKTEQQRGRESAQLSQQLIKNQIHPQKNKSEKWNILCNWDIYHRWK